MPIPNGQHSLYPLRTDRLNRDADDPPRLGPVIGLRGRSWHHLEYHKDVSMLKAMFVADSYHPLGFPSAFAGLHQINETSIVKAIDTSMLRFPRKVRRSEWSGSCYVTWPALDGAKS